MQAWAVYGMGLAGPGLQLFRHVAGQGVEHLPVDETLSPGVYRIVSGLTGTALQVSEHDHTKVVSWQSLEKKESQQWYLERSGSGYKFRNQEHKGLYLSVASTDTHALVTASKFPSTWVFLKIGNRHGIKLADSDKLVDLHFGREANGTEVHIWPGDGSKKQTWNLVRIDDEFMDKADRIVMLEKELIQLKDEMAGKNELIAHHENTIRQLREDLKARESSNLQARVSQQQTEIASLQSKVDRLEYILSQVDIWSANGYTKQTWELFCVCDIDEHIKDHEETAQANQKSPVTQKDQRLKDPGQLLEGLRKEIAEMRTEIIKMGRDQASVKVLSDRDKRI
ncbi:unnamed protein product [Rhizoctonia solani]|uniref:Ricin B lectin domain-containing protein n=1 Tax=Rhizoctonia solani TaxID=456999 RepID=A0A8H3ADE9_9AGAM|nr:unnamed protein product [Rhizoctonia solani]